MKSACVAGLLALGVSAGLASAAIAADGCEGRAGAHKLVVQVTGVRGARGQMAVTLYPDDAKRFLAPHRKLLRVRATAQTPTTTACFWLPAPAYYAVSVYHDENGNRDFDRTRIGLPAEGFAFSNDPSTLTGLPAFREVRVKAAAGETRIRVKLRYLR